MHSHRHTRRNKGIVTNTYDMHRHRQEHTHADTGMFKDAAIDTGTEEGRDTGTDTDTDTDKAG